MGKIYDLGIDVGSTTVKTVILDEGEFIYNKYERHFSKVRETVAEQLRAIRELYPEDKFRIAITGSAGLGIAEASGISFVQEVFSAFIAVNKKYPKADVVVELGGEDAKIIFLTGGVEQRMNGSCAGGTGAFIDQMAGLLGVTPDEMNDLALKAERLILSLQDVVFSQSLIFSRFLIRAQEKRTYLRLSFRLLWIRLFQVWRRAERSAVRCFPWGSAYISQCTEKGIQNYFKP